MQGGGLATRIDTGVNQAVIDFLDCRDDEFGAVFGADAVCGAIAHARQRGIVERISTPFVARWKIQHDASVGDLKHDTEPEFGFGVADPALARLAVECHGPRMIANAALLWARLR